MRLADSRTIGIFPLQQKGYKSKKFDLQLRASIFGVRITDRYTKTGDIGHWEFDKESLGDINGGQLWTKDSREVPMWRFATPVKIGGPPAPNNDVETPSDNPNRQNSLPSSAGPGSTNGPSGGTGGSLASSNPGYNASGGNALGAGGGGPSSIVLEGAGAGQLRPTVTEGVGPGGSRPGDTRQNPPGSGGGEGASPPSCGTSPDGDFIMFPILDGKYAADERLKSIKPAIFKVDGKRAWPKFPKGSVGISLVADEENEQVDLFHPTDPRLVAVNKAGDKEMGSLVFDLNKNFEYDKDRGVPLQSMMWVLKKPLGASNAIAWQLGPSGCKDTRGGYVMDDSTGGTTPAQASAGAGQARPTVTEVPTKGPSKVVARASRNNGGPFDVGSGKCRHVLGRDADGNPISRLHLDIGTLFREDDGHDGPLNVTNWKKGDAQDKKVPVNFGWNAGAQKWDWWTTTYVHYSPSPPPYPYSPSYTPVGTTPVGTATPSASRTPVGTSTPVGGSPVATGGFNIWDVLKNTLYGDGGLPGTGTGGGGTTGGGTTGGGSTGNTGGPAGTGGTATGGGTGAPNNPGPGAGQGTQPPQVNPDGTTPSDPEPPTGTQEWADWNKRRKQRREDFPGGNLMGSVINQPQGYAMIDQALATGQMLAKPYNNYPNMPNLANMAQIPEGIAQKYAMENPITAQMTAFGAQGGPSTTIASNPAAPPPAPSLPPASPNPVPSPGSPPAPTPPAPPTSPTVSPPAPSPVTTQAAQIGATGDPWDYTWRPQANTNYNGGTSPGGWTFNPPEVPFSSWPDDMTPLEGQGAVSETFVGAGPGASWFAGAADVASGKPKDCMSWGKSSSNGDLVFKSHYGGSSPGIEAIRFSHQNQEISFAARTGLLGTLSHNNTSARRWAFPDESGTVVVATSHVAVAWGAQATLHTIGGSGPTVANQDSWMKIYLGSTAFYLPLWR